MVTWTFDLTALIVGFIVGMVIGAVIAMFAILYEGGDWDKGFNDGFDARRFMEKNGYKIKNDNKGESNNE